MNFKLSDLTLAGWLLTLVTIGLIVVLIIASLLLSFMLLPSGRYPSMMFVLLAAPGFIIGIIFFAISAVLLKAVGLAVVKQTPKSEQLAQEHET